jgi:hypothetical protein
MFPAHPSWVSVLNSWIVAFALLDPLNTVTTEMHYSYWPTNGIRVDGGLLFNKMVNCPLHTEPLDYVMIGSFFSLNRLNLSNKVISYIAPSIVACGQCCLVICRSAEPTLGGNLISLKSIFATPFSR